MKRLIFMLAIVLSFAVASSAQTATTKTTKKENTEVAAKKDNKPRCNRSTCSTCKTCPPTCAQEKCKNCKHDCNSDYKCCMPKKDKNAKKGHVCTKSDDPNHVCTHNKTKDTKEKK